MRFLIASPILRDHSVGCQDMDINGYDSMVGLIKAVSSGLWGGALCLLQGSFAFVVDATTRLVMEISDIHILGVILGRHSKGSKMLRGYPLTRKIAVSYFRHFDKGVVTKCAYVLVHNIPSSVSVQEELNLKVRHNLGSNIKVNERFLEGYAPPVQETAVVCGVRENAVYPSPAQLQDSFRVPCVFRKRAGV